MKIHYKVPLLSIAVVLSCCILFFFAQKTSSKRVSGHKARVSAAPDLPVSSSAMSGIRQSLAGREYNITYDSTRQTLQSPNRKQNLRASYKPGMLSLAPRITKKDSHFVLNLRLDGIYAGSVKAYRVDTAARIEQAENELRIHHKGFTEEYINNEAGIRQNFIIHEKRSEAALLKVKLNVEGARPVSAGINAVGFVQAGHEEARLTYNDFKCWDDEGQPLDGSVTIQGNDIVLAVNVKDAVYPITIDPIIANGTPANANTVLRSNQQGANAYAVASAGDVNGDGYSDVLVGAPFYDKGENDEGAVFVFQGSAAGLNANAVLLLEGNQVNAQFGTSVSTAGDVNADGYSDVLVGAPLYDKGQTDEGAAFLYFGSAGGIKLAGAVTFEANQASAYFGQSVATIGDANADGFSDIIVGAQLYDNGQTNEGAAFIYKGSAGAISAVAATVLESNQANASFGYSVAGAGDINGDGFGDVVVGSMLYDNGQDNEGAAFVFHSSAAGVNPVAAIRLEGNQVAAIFGWSVSTAGDVNGDGFSDIIVGAYSYDKGETNEGAAFIYHGSAAGISANAATTLESNQAEAVLGIAVACAGDVNGDGYSDVIVGAKYYDKGQANEGAAFVYHGSAAGIYANAVATLESNQANAWLGTSVASAGDVNGDGYSDVIAGAPTFDKVQYDEGGAFVFHGSAYSVDLVTSTIFLGGQNGAQFGWSVASAGDVNGDGFGDIIIGANEYDNGQADEGAAFIYYGSKAGLDMASPTILEINKPLSAFGSSVASAGDVNGDGYGDVIVGAYLYDNAKENAGAIFVFHGSKNGINQTIQFKAEGAQEDANMGKSVSSAGDVNGDGFDDIIVGAPGYDLEAPLMDEGVAFIFNGSPAGITQNTRILPGDTRGIYFGSSVATVGDCNSDGYSDVIVGSPLFGQDENYEGAVFVYYGSPTGTNVLPGQTLESGQDGARLGGSVAAAGDINGDGLPDFVAGADRYTNGEYQEGACFVYYAGPNGFFTCPEILERNFMGALLGSAVHGAGDLNGDGYSDVIIGALGYTNGQFNEGSFYVYLGSSSGIANGFVMSAESNQEGAFLGHSVASGGDVNGDGFSDILISAHQFDQTKYNEGIVYVAYGNTGVCLRNNLRIYNSDLISPIAQSQFAKNDFGAGLYSKSFLGRGKGKLVWETRPKGQPFSKVAGGTITTSTQFTGMQNIYASLGSTGTELKSLITKQGVGTKVRTRVKFDPVLAMTGQVYGPWRYTQSNLSGASNAPARQAQVAMTTAGNLEEAFAEISIYPNPVTDWLHIQTSETYEIASVEIRNVAGASIYKSVNASQAIDAREFAPGTYIIIMGDQQGRRTSRKFVVSR
ncbi:FG-GAP-like repeat-containing protein [Dyadobacter sandarakinus]|uniref:FG-GAP repeat protein n=1 Tax=Dyadobacter sandarakinus TaxID=2747268 RepID=A0ABX7I353_9BACT|nr:FG-GAP-like repeat-containing protein [Dyadobacter sandarakinus]QRR00489.1 FG-GAP repeat protein [Dyadobacter sandarakinus]